VDSKLDADPAGARQVPRHRPTSHDAGEGLPKALLSAEDYERLKRRDRRVIRTGEMTDAEIALIAKAEVPAEQAYFDEESKTGARGLAECHCNWKYCKDAPVSSLG